MKSRVVSRAQILDGGLGSGGRRQRERKGANRGKKRRLFRERDDPFLNQRWTVKEV